MNVIWQWPTKQMPWFLWGYRFTNPNERAWRVGPLTLWVRD
jgi:hypothetical protein